MSFLDLTDTKESTFEPIPAGTYNLIVSSAEVKDTKNFDKRLALTFTVTDGEYAGRKIFEGYQLSGSQKAVDIGKGQLKALWRCAGHSEFVIHGPEQFINIEISASVKVKKDDEFGDRNSISTFKPKIKTEASQAVPF